MLRFYMRVGWPTNDVGFISNFGYILYMIRHDDFTWFHIIRDVFCDSIKDTFFKNVKNMWGGALFLVKNAGLK